MISNKNKLIISIISMILLYYVTIQSQFNFKQIDKLFLLGNLWMTVKGYDYLFTVLKFPIKLYHFQDYFLEDLFIFEGNKLDFYGFIVGYLTINSRYNISTLAKFIMHLQYITILYIRYPLHQHILFYLHITINRHYLFISICNISLYLFFRK